jgi:LEA14-like dessication related protein
MKKGVKIWVLIAILMVVGSGIVTMASAGLGIIPDYPEIRELHHDIEAIGHNSTQVHSTTVLYNPNICPIKFKRVEYSIFLNDILIGSGHSGENVMVMPRSEKKLTFESEIYLKQIPKWLKERIKTGEETNVNIKGNIIFDLGILDYKHPINITVTELWKKRFNNRFLFAYPATDITGDKISEMIIDVWHFEDDYISGEVRVVNGVDGSLLWDRSLGIGIPVAYPATDLNGDNVTEFIVNVWDIDRNLATRIFVLDGVDGSTLWEWEDENGLAAAYPCTDFNGDNITEIVVNSYSIIEEEESLSSSTATIQAMAKMEAENVTDEHITKDKERDDRDSSTSNYTYLRLSVRPQDVSKEANIEFSAILSDSYGETMPNKALMFYVDENFIGSRKTESGWALLSYDTSNLAIGYHEIKVVFDGDSEYKPSSEREILMVNPLTESVLQQDYEFFPILKGDERGFAREKGITSPNSGWREYDVSNISREENVSDLPTMIMWQSTFMSFTDDYADYGIDTDGDGKYNYLAINVGVDIKKAGKYRIEGSLKDNSTGNHIEWASTDRILDVGMQNVTLKFNGYEIYRHGTNGKFDLKYLRALDKNWNTVDYRDFTYTTSYYSFTDFDVPPADITVSYYDYGIDTDGDGKYNYLAMYG